MHTRPDFRSPIGIASDHVDERAQRHRDVAVLGVDPRRVDDVHQVAEVERASMIREPSRCVIATGSRCSPRA